MRRATLLLPLAIVGACAGPRPPAPRDAQVAPPAAWLRPEAPGSKVDCKWWKEFGDPALSSLVEQALAQNDDIAIAAKRVEEFRAQYRLSVADRLPNVVASGQGGRDKYVDPFGQGVYENAGQGALSVSYDLDLFGRLRNASRAVRGAMLASEAGGDAVKLAVASSTATAYLTLRSLDARLLVLRDTLRAREESLHLAQRRALSGYSPILDQRQAEAEYSATAQLIPATLLAIRRTENGLRLLLGETPGDVPRGSELSALALPAISPGLPASLLRRRPDIRQAEEQLVAADRSLDSVRAAFLPSLQLNGSSGYVASSLLADPIAVFSVGGGIVASILDFGRNRARQSAAAARRDQAAFAYRKTALQAFREVEDALASVDLSGSQEQALVKQEAALRSAVSVATQRYRSGYSPYLEQLDAQRALLSAQLSLIQSRKDRLTAAVSLYQALGGGWSEEGPNG